MKFSISKISLANAVETSILDSEEKLYFERLFFHNHSGNIQVDTDTLPLTILKYYYDNSKGLTPKIKAQIAVRLSGSGLMELIDNTDIWNTDVMTIEDFCIVFAKLQSGQPNADYFYEGRWYPIYLNLTLFKKTKYNDACVFIETTLKIAETYTKLQVKIDNYYFKDRYGRKRKQSFYQLLSPFKIRQQQTSLELYKQNLFNAEILREKSGQQMIYSQLNNLTLDISLTEKIIIEPSLEVEDNQNKDNYQRRNNDNSLSVLPFVRAFSLNKKRFCYIDINDLEDYIY